MLTENQTKDPKQTGQNEKTPKQMGQTKQTKTHNSELLHAFSRVTASRQTS